MQPGDGPVYIQLRTGRGAVSECTTQKMGREEWDERVWASPLLPWVASSVSHWQHWPGGRDPDAVQRKWVRMADNRR